MTLQQLEYIVAVYRHKHFAKAAENCNVTQPTLSSMVQKLEDELSVKIFDRKTNPITVTPIGRLVVEQAWRTLLRARKIKETVEEEKHSLMGTFRVGILPTIAPYLIPRFLPQLMRKYPEMDIRVAEMKTEDIKRALRHDDIDAGILAQLDDMDDFNVTPLFFEQFFAYVAREDNLFKNKTIKTSDLTEEYLWLLDEGHCFRDQLVSFCHLKSARRSQRSYHLGSIETFMRIVESGMGATFIPELCTLQLSDEQKKLVRPFALPVPTREIVLLTAKDFVRDSLKRLLVDEIRKSVPESMHRLSHAQKSI